MWRRGNHGNGEGLRWSTRVLPARIVRAPEGETQGLWASRPATSVGPPLANARPTRRCKKSWPRAWTNDARTTRGAQVPDDLERVCGPSHDRASLAVGSGAFDASNAHRDVRVAVPCAMIESSVVHDHRRLWSEAG